MKKIVVRLVLATSIDGRIAYPTGGETHIGGNGDREALESAIAWSDATLMGGETLRNHRSVCLIRSDELIQERILKGMSKQPIAIIASRKNNFSTSWAFFNQPINRWLITTSQSQPALNAQPEYEKKIFLQKNWAQTLSLLYSEGISKLALLGGANLISNFLLEDQIDELQLTITPRVIGARYSWPPSDINSLPMVLSKKNAWILKDFQSLGENELLIRYLRNRAIK